MSLEDPLDMVCLSVFLSPLISPFVALSLLSLSPCSCGSLFLSSIFQPHQVVRPLPSEGDALLVAIKYELESSEGTELLCLCLNYFAFALTTFQLVLDGVP